MKNKSWYRYPPCARESLLWRYRLITVPTLVFAFSVWLAHCAQATECPPGVPRCKVLVITPDMEQALTGPNMILDTAAWGNRLGLDSAVQFFKRAIADAPAGDVKNPTVPKAEEKK